MSSSSNGSENTETRDLNRTKTTDALKTVFSGLGDTQAQVQKGLQHRKIAHRPLQSSLKGPRRIGTGTFQCRCQS